MVETGTDPVYATRLFLDLAEKEYSSTVIEFVLVGGYLGLLGVYVFVINVITLKENLKSTREYSIL